MDVPEKIFNIQYLSHFAGLDTQAGVAESGSRKAYFDALQTFLEDVPRLLATFDEHKPPKELADDVDALQLELYKICDVGITPKIGELLVLVKKKGDARQISNKFFEIQNAANTLCRKIQLAVIGPESAEKAKQEPAAAGEKGTPQYPAPVTGDEALEDMVVPAGGGAASLAAAGHDFDAPRFHKAVRPEGFAKVQGLIEEFEFDAALRGAKALARFSYGDKVDRALNTVVDGLESGNYKGARQEAISLMKYVQEAYAAEQAAPRKPVILAIDDVADVLTALKNMLRKDYVVYCVTNSSAALKFLADNTPDLILMDVEMPGMSGPDLARVVKQMQNCQKVPIIFLSGNASEEAIKESVEAGGEGFIRKPVDYQTLMDRLGRHLKKQRR